jgi:hypothetical protein
VSVNCFAVFADIQAAWPCCYDGALQVLLESKAGCG